MCACTGTRKQLYHPSFNFLSAYRVYTDIYGYGAKRIRRVHDDACRSPIFVFENFVDSDTRSARDSPALRRVSRSFLSLRVPPGDDAPRFSPTVCAEGDGATRVRGASARWRTGRPRERDNATCVRRILLPSLSPSTVSGRARAQALYLYARACAALTLPFPRCYFRRRQGAASRDGSSRANVQRSLVRRLRERARWPGAQRRKQFRGTKTTLSQAWSGNCIRGPQCAFEMSMFMCPAVHKLTRN